MSSACPILFLLITLVLGIAAHSEQVVISEVMYHPPANLPEFLEIENLTATPFDIAEWTFSEGIAFSFPPFDPSAPGKSFLKAFQRIVICNTDPSTFRTAYGVPAEIAVYGPWAGNLSDSGERVTLNDKNGVRACSLRYDDKEPWPPAADGAGHSLVLIDNSRAIDDERRWKASRQAGGSPGQKNARPAARNERPVINEVHFTDTGHIAWVELYNPSATTIATAGMAISNTRDHSTTIPLQSSLPPMGFATVDLDFNPADDGFVLYLLDTTGNVIDAITTRFSPLRPYFAAHPDGTTDFYLALSGSRAEPNHPERETSIVINELMVDPPSGLREGEFLELYNKGTTAIDLSGWQFSQGIGYTFPTGTTMTPGSYLVLAANSSLTQSVHPNARVLGNYSGSLSNTGERVRLIDAWGNTVDTVHYHTGGDWPRLAAGQGSSLELRHPEMDNSVASAWVDSNESEKSTFQTFTFTEDYLDFDSSLLSNPSDYKELHVHAVGEAHLVMRQMDLRGDAGNLLPNQGTTITGNGTGTDGWLCQGNHYQSTIDGTEFHLVSTGHGDAKANRCEIDIPDVQPWTTLTFTMEARWISGKPTVVVQTWDRSFGNIVHLPIPDNLGTPGAANSTLHASPAPTIDGLTHHPSVPSSASPVTVHAQVRGATQVELVHRPDSAAGDAPWQATAMADDGRGHYSATLTSYQTDGQIVEFYVRAQSPEESTQLPTGGNERPAMWIVDDSLVPSDLRTQRFIISERSVRAAGPEGATSAFHYQFPRLSNQYAHATFISDEETILYNCEFRKSGSTWTRTTEADFSRAKWKPPGDRPFRGYTKRSIDNDIQSEFKSYHNRITRYWLYLLGHPVSENEFVRVIVNREAPTLNEDTEPITNDFLKRHWAEGQLGELYRIDDEWLFKDDWDFLSADARWTYKDTDEPERYHTEWMKRTRESEYDYSSYVAWVKTLHENTFSQKQLENLADIDLMAANAAVRSWIDDWDTLTQGRGKNGYFYRRPTDHRWMFLQWDSDGSFRDVDGPFLGNLEGVSTFYEKPYVRQRFNLYLGELIDQYTAQSERLNAWFQCEEEASESYETNAAFYHAWNVGRIAYAEDAIGESLSTPLLVTSNVQATITATIDLTGRSPYNTHHIKIAGHPEAESQLLSPTTWSATGIQLSRGSNTLTVQALDRQGKVVGSVNHLITKVANTPPILSLLATPSSWRLPVQETLSLDGTASYDPENSPLSASWQATPSDGIFLTHPTLLTGQATFTKPGHYQINLLASDAEGGQSAASREVSVYRDANWSSFSSESLDAIWVPEQVRPRSGNHATAWYSLQDRPGKLTMRLPDNTTRPLNSIDSSYPILSRPLPESGDWSWDTKVTLASIQRGNFFSGSIVDLVSTPDGNVTRYAFGLAFGNSLHAYEISSTQSRLLTQLAPWQDTSATLRIRRSINILTFEYLSAPGNWTVLGSNSLATNTRNVRAGIMLSHVDGDSSPSARVEFDHTLLITDEDISEPLALLRITEIMFHPVSPDLEYLELANLGNLPLNLNGVTFEAGHPFAEFVFDSTILAPGEHAVLVANQAAFEAAYGVGNRVLGQWSSGALGNGGERIVLLAPNGDTLIDFTYGDQLPWPTAADGSGPSLEVINPFGAYDHPENWFAVLGQSGSPGRPLDQDLDGLSNTEELALGTSPTLSDTDGDDFDDGAEIVAGTDPLDATSRLAFISLTLHPSTGIATASWHSVPGKTYQLETNDTLTESTWRPVTMLESTGTVTGATDTSVRLREARRFYRVRVISP